MVALFVLGPLWIHIMVCRGEEPSREVLLSWVRERLLDGLGLEEPPLTSDRLEPRRFPRTTRTAWVNRESRSTQETSQIILFPSSDSSCTTSASSSVSTHHFLPSMNHQNSQLTSANFWFFAGGAANSSAQLFLLTPAQQLLQAADAPSQASSDGWLTFDLNRNLLASVSEGPFLLQVICPGCRCHTEPDKTPFLHLHLHSRPRGAARSPRSAPLTIPWSPAAIDLLQRPSQETHGDCHRAEVEISFEELGWDSWIVQPEVLTFYYCTGNCSARDRTAAMLGVTQCCAPVPGSMKNLRITTTSDGGYSFKYETLPNIVPEECACI